VRIICTDASRTVIAYAHETSRMLFQQEGPCYACRAWRERQEEVGKGWGPRTLCSHPAAKAACGLSCAKSHWPPETMVPLADHNEHVLSLHSQCQIGSDITDGRHNLDHDGEWQMKERRTHARNFKQQGFSLINHYSDGPSKQPRDESKDQGF
jgi:hypothetical protein